MLVRQIKIYNEFVGCDGITNTSHELFEKNLTKTLAL